jgi:DNA modification methylase
MENKVICGDCLQVMREIPDKNINMILCDLPYGTTACKWDTIIPFEPLWEQYKRIIKDNGAIVLTASQPFTSALVMSNVSDYSHNWIWIKNKVTKFLSVKSQPLSKTEDVLVFYQQYDDTFTDWRRQYFKKILEFIGKNKKYIVEKLGQGLDHCFRYGSRQFAVPTKENYQLLENEFKISNFSGYKQYLEIQDVPRVYNPQGIVKFEIKKLNNGKKKKENDVYNFECDRYEQEFTNYPTNILEFNTDIGLHPTQKPVALFEYLIKTYTNEGDLVLDNCAGSGTTGVACKNLNRNYILIEKEPKYIEIINKRLNNL